MKRLLVVAAVSVTLACGGPAGDVGGGDSDLATFIDNIGAVDNHSHPNSTAPGDTDSDALPLDGIAPFQLPARLRTENPEWLAAYKALYGYTHSDLSEPHMAELRQTMQRVAKEKGEAFPEWAIGQSGTEIQLANRIAPGPGLTSQRFRWVPFADPLMLPLSSAGEAATTPDREKLYPLEDKLLKRYLADLKVPNIPATLDEYLKSVVTATLDAQKRTGAVAVKFEIAYLRGLDIGDASQATAAAVYVKYAKGGVPPPADYKTLQDFLFRFIARECGRLGMSVHIHSLEGAGDYFASAGADPLLLESVFNDSSLRKTTFVIIHGGGAFAAHTQAMLWKPNVMADISLMSLAYPPATVADTLRSWLATFPEKVLFGSDASAFGPDMGWELTSWLGSRSARRALTIALTGMMRDEEISRARAEDIARMVMRMNASRLYGLGLK